MDGFLEATSYILPLIIAITLHEAAHGYVASKLGDQTAKLSGRVTFDPLKHVDMYGTIIVPALMLICHSPVLFGYAKPVPVDYRKLRRPRLDPILVALAGPGMNILLAYVSALLTHMDAIVTPEQAPWTYMNIYNSINVNVMLAVFNLLPILPLDGGRVVNALLPARMARAHAETERLGMLAIAVLFLLPAFLSQAHLPSINFGYYLIGVPADFLRDVLLHAAGIGDNG